MKLNITLYLSAIFPAEHFQVISKVHPELVCFIMAIIKIKIHDLRKDLCIWEPPPDPKL